MAFKPTHYGKIWRKKGKTYRWAYSGNLGQWRKLQEKKLVSGRRADGGRWKDRRWVTISKAWHPSPSRSAVPWRKYR